MHTCSSFFFSSVHWHCLWAFSLHMTFPSSTNLDGITQEGLPKVYRGLRLMFLVDPLLMKGEPLFTVKFMYYTLSLWQQKSIVLWNKKDTRWGLHTNSILKTELLLRYSLLGSLSLSQHISLLLHGASSHSTTCGTFLTSSPDDGPFRHLLP